MDKTTFHKISYGVYVICSKNKEKINGQIANALFQATSDPPMIVVSINKQNLTHKYIDTSKVFTISILDINTPLTLIGTFGFKSGRDIDKFKKVNFKLGATQSPIILDNTLAYLEAQVIDKVDVGTHTIFIGKIIDSAILSKEKAMTYDYYHEVKGGYSPKPHQPMIVILIRKPRKKRRM